MEISRNHRRIIAWMVMGLFLYLAQVSAVPTPGTAAAAAVKKTSGTETIEENDGIGAIEKSTATANKGKKKKFPWLLVAAGVVAVGAVLYFTVLKKQQKYSLDVSIGEGVEGNPTNGTTKYDKGASVSYSFSAKSGYENLSVTLDGQAAASSGNIIMDKDHTLNASATQVIVNPAVQYTLTVDLGEGVTGTPASGTYTYAEGTSVNYSYAPKSNFMEMDLTLDSTAISSSGSFAMNGNRTITARAKEGFLETFDSGLTQTWHPHTPSAWSVISGVYKKSSASSDTPWEWNWCEFKFSKAQFTTETRVRQMGNNTNKGITLFLYGEGGLGYYFSGYEFYYNPNGAVIARRVENIDRRGIPPGGNNFVHFSSSNHPAVAHSLGSWNTLKVNRYDDNYIFAINNTIVCSFNDSTFDVRYMCFVIQDINDMNNTPIEIDWVSMYAQGKT